MKVKLKGNSRLMKEIIFFTIMMIVPTVQYLIFGFGIKINLITLAFQTFNVDTNQMEWNLLGNFEKFFAQYNESLELQNSIRNSLSLPIWTIFLSIFIGVFFSLYIYKKQFGSRAFKVLLFMPSIVSAIVMTRVFSMFVDRAYPDFLRLTFGVEAPLGLLANKDTRWATLIFYSLWSGFGSSILLYVGAMSSISESLSEAAKLDGCNMLQESIFITIPLIYQTILVYITTGIAAIFVNQLNLYSFYQHTASASVSTMGYWIYIQTLSAGGQTQNYAYLSAVGLLLSCITVPTTLIIKWFLNKVGPKTE